MSHYLTLKGIGHPVAYFPRLGVFLDSVTAGVFLCQMIYWHDKAASEFGVYKSADEITEETGLTYREQATARKKLVALGLIEETNRRLEHKIYFKFMPDVFDEWLSGCLGIEIGERRKRISGDAESAIGRTTKTQFVIQENTQENTSKNKQRSFSEAFEIFWSEYPASKRKGSKTDACKTFSKYENKSDLIMTVLRKFKLDEQWTKQEGQFIPSPSSWLNKKHWENEFWLDSPAEKQSQAEETITPKIRYAPKPKNYLD